MGELRKVLVFLFVAILIFYMVRLFYFTKKKWTFKKYVFTIMIGGLGLLFIATFLDIFAEYMNNFLIFGSIKVFFLAGSITYVIGIILWTNFTKEMMVRLDTLTLMDPMTGIFNRRGIERVYDSVAESKKNFYVIVCDLDGTKRINDNYGHIEGDKYINEAAKIISAVIGLNGYLSRIGGDEFILLLSYVGLEELQNNISTIKKQVSELYTDQNTGISMGAALFPDEGKTLSELIEVADEKMYVDKKKLRVGKREL